MEPSYFSVTLSTFFTICHLAFFCFKSQKKALFATGDFAVIAIEGLLYKNYKSSKLCKMEVKYQIGDCCKLNTNGLEESASI